MANKFLTIDMITYEALLEFGNELNFAKKVNRTYSNQFGKEGAKIGDTVRVRLEQNYTVSDGASLELQDIVERNTTVEINKRKHIGLEYSQRDRVLSMDDMSRRIIKPAIKAIAHQVESDLIALIPQVPKMIVWDTNSGTQKPFSVFSKARAVLEDAYIPSSDLSAFIGPFANAVLADSLTQLAFNNEKSNKALDKNKVGHLAGIDIYTSPLLKGYVMGTAVEEATITVDGASQASLANGSVTIKGMVGTLKKGDTFTFAGVYDVNPITKDVRSTLKQFTVLEDVAAAGTVVKFAPAIVESGAYKNVSSVPANNAKVSFLGTSAGTYEMGVVFAKDAFALVSADLPLNADSNKCSRASDNEVGVSIRVTDVYEPKEDVTILRFDALYGVNTLDTNQAVKIATKY